MDPSPSGSPGKYTCVFVLGLPGSDSFEADIDIGAFVESGRSLLSFPQGMKRIEFALTIEGRLYDLALERNSLGEAASLRASVDSSGLLAAEALFPDNILPLVSWLSCRHDVGLTVRGWVVTEVRTGVHRVRVGLLGTSRPLDATLPALELTAEMRSLFAAYREGSVVTNVFFQALSYWKVVEGVYFLRSQAADAALRQGEQPPPFPRERIPERIGDVGVDEWAAHGFNGYLGKKFTFVRDDLSKRLRDAVAHLVPGSTSLRSLSPDTFNDVSSCEEAVPVLRYMARTLMTNHLVWLGKQW